MYWAKPTLDLLPLSAGLTLIHIWSVLFIQVTLKEAFGVVDSQNRLYDVIAFVVNVLRAAYPQCTDVEATM